MDLRALPNDLRVFNPSFFLSYFFPDGGQLFIGREVTLSGGIAAGTWLIGDLSRFNLWIKSFSPSEIENMAKKCGGETGDIVAWPEIKYYIEEHVEYHASTCIKPGVYHVKPNKTCCLYKIFAKWIV